MTKLVVILGFLVAFGAGIVAGLNVRKDPVVVPTDTTTRRSHPRTMGPIGWLEKELGLDANQKEKLKEIWSEVAKRKPWEQEERRRQYRKEKDDAVAALVRPEDYGKFDQILKTYGDRLTALELEERTAFQQAVQDTKAILTLDQRVKYEDLLRRHAGDRRGGPGGRDRDKDKDREKDKDRDKDRDNHKDKEHGRRPEPRATSTRAATPN